MITIKLQNKGSKTKSIKFPDKYEDLTFKQYIDINKIMMEDIKPKQRDRNIIAYLLKIDNKSVGTILTSVYNELLDCLKFLLDDIPVTNEITELTINNEKYVRRDLTTLTIDEQEFIDQIAEVHGYFESMPYLMGVIFTKPNEEDKLITQKQLDYIAEHSFQLPFVTIYNVFFSSTNLNQISMKNMESYLKSQLKLAEEKALEMI